MCRTFVPLLSIDETQHQIKHSRKVKNQEHQTLTIPTKIITISKNFTCSVCWDHIEIEDREPIKNLIS